MNFNQRLNQLKAAIDKAKTDRATAEANKKNAEERITEIDAEIKGLGYEPDKIEDVVLDLDRKIKADIAEIEGMIPQEYRGGW